MSFAVGSLITARGREWVVLPDSTDEVVIARPLGGTDDEIAGICTALEEIQPAAFALPDPANIGDYRSCRVLRDALRLGFRSSAGPFRCFGKIAVEPRPYQLVPLLMGLKLDPVRLLIADDVGVALYGAFGGRDGNQRAIHDLDGLPLPQPAGPFKPGFNDARKRAIGL